MDFSILQGVVNQTDTDQYVLHKVSMEKKEDEAASSPRRQKKKHVQIEWMSEL